MFEVDPESNYTSRTLVFCYISLQAQSLMGSVEAAEIRVRSQETGGMRKVSLWVRRISL